MKHKLWPSLPSCLSILFFKVSCTSCLKNIRWSWVQGHSSCIELTVCAECTVLLNKPCCQHQCFRTGFLLDSSTCCQFYFFIFWVLFFFWRCLSNILDWQPRRVCMSTHLWSRYWADESSVEFLCWRQLVPAAGLTPGPCASSCSVQLPPAARQVCLRVGM